MIHGRNLIVTVDNTIVAASTGCKLNLSQEFLKVCSPAGGRTMEKIPTTYDWGLSVDCLVGTSAYANSLMDKLIAGTKCFVTFTDSSNQKRAGYCYVKSCDENGPVAGIANFSVSFESSGPLYCYSEQTPYTDTMLMNKQMEIASDHYTLVYDTWNGKNLYIAEVWSPKMLQAIGTTDIWAVYQCTAQSYKQYIQNGDYTTLATKLIDYNWGPNAFINPPYGPVTIVCNSAAAKVRNIYEV